MSIQTEKAREVRMRRLIRSNPDAKRLYNDNVALRIRVAELEKQTAPKASSKAKGKDS